MNIKKLTPELYNICRKKGTEQDKVQDLLKAKHYIDLELETKYQCDSEGNKLIG